MQERTERMRLRKNAVLARASHHSEKITNVVALDAYFMIDKADSKQL